jgi:hypothetical protein
MGRMLHRLEWEIKQDGRKWRRKCVVTVGSHYKSKRENR